MEIESGRVWVEISNSGIRTASELERLGIPVTKFFLLSGNECKCCDRPRLMILPDDAPLCELRNESSVVKSPEAIKEAMDKLWKRGIDRAATPATQAV